MENGETTRWDVQLVMAAAAAAHAEGWWVPHSLPRRHNNPGDLLNPAAENISYATPLHGWQSLLDQWERILDGQSRVYKLEMTWRRVAELWTGGDNAEYWCAAFCSDLGVTAESTVADFLQPPRMAPAQESASIPDAK